jgi:hypothetical protein
MPQISPGVFNCGIGNTKAVWSVRLNPKVKQVYAQAYGTDDLISSIDMINVKPPIEPFHDPDQIDWAHTDNHNMFDRCVQGQVVLSNTSAGPLCSPRSHLICSALLGFRRKHNINSDPEARAEAKRMVELVGGKFQVPVIAPKGSVIMWLSSMLHSAKLMDRPVASESFDGWKGWRCVVYLAYRPKIGVNKEHLAQLKLAYEKNLTTRHTGELFDAKDISKYPDHEKYTAKIHEIYQSVVIDSMFPIEELRQELTLDVMTALGMH